VDFDREGESIANPPWTAEPESDDGSLAEDSTHFVSPPKSAHFTHAPPASIDFVLERTFDDQPSGVVLDFDIEPGGSDERQYVSDVLWETDDGDGCRVMLGFELQQGNIQNQVNIIDGINYGWDLNTSLGAGFHHVTLQIDFLTGETSLALDDDPVDIDGPASPLLLLAPECRFAPIEDSLELWVGARYTSPTKPFDAYYDNVVFRSL